MSQAKITATIMVIRCDQDTLSKMAATHLSFNCPVSAIVCIHICSGALNRLELDSYSNHTLHRHQNTEQNQMNTARKFEPAHISCMSIGVQPWQYSSYALRDFPGSSGKAGC